jgi:hypothetical protein
MSEIIISSVKTRKELKQFARFGYELYKDSPYAVPDLMEDTLDTLDPQKNPAFRFCEAEMFLARRDGKIVGRVAAIINRRANETWQTKHVRFGWIDFVDDIEVTRQLMQTVEEWGKKRGMTHVIGPLGFTDLDPEGMLTEGYDQLGTVFSIYNYPYYPQHMEQLGFRKEQGWVERKVMVPNKGHEANMQKYFKIAQLVEERYGFRIRKFKSKKEIQEGGYIEKILGVVNKAYAKLYEYSALDEQQMKAYADRFLMLLDKRYLSVVENAEGEVIGMGVCITSLSRAVQKAKSRLFPFGWYHIAKALWFNKHPRILDMLLVGVLPEYHDKGANALIFANIIPEATKDGYEWAETHPQLEENLASQTQWKNLDCSIHKRRAAFGKDIY